MVLVDFLSEINLHHDTLGPDMAAHKYCFDNVENEVCWRVVREST